jgi:hypothetical protein
MRYDRAELIETYLATRSVSGRFGAYEVERDEYNEALREYYQGLLAALERMFGITLDRQREESFDARVVLTIFVNTANSLLAARTPWSGYLEAGLLVNRLKEAGAAGQKVLAQSAVIEELQGKSRAAHLEALDAIAEILLGDSADLAFDSAEVLSVVGFDDNTRPNQADYPDI